MKQGFSLIELLVVVAIIGVLAGAGVVGYQGYLTGVRADTAVNQMRQIASGLESAEIAAANNLTAADDACERDDSVSGCITALITGMKSPYTGTQLVFDADGSACGTSDTVTGQFFGTHTPLGGSSVTDFSTVNMGQVPTASGIGGTITLTACDDQTNPTAVGTTVDVDMGT